MLAFATKKSQLVHSFVCSILHTREFAFLDSFRFKYISKRIKSPLQFWALEGGQWPNLQPLARRLFSLIATSASSERNFSAMGFIHNKVRNRLKHATVDKIVFVRANTMLRVPSMGMLNSVESYFTSDSEDTQVPEEHSEKR